MSKVLNLSLLAIGGLTIIPNEACAKQKPINFVVIYCDDMGYGDLGCYGSPSINTPNLDRMAYEGQRWSSFYSASSVSTPSRAALLTARYPKRNNQTGVYFPDSEGGLPQSEKTVATLLKEKSYTTALVGKWHLGHKEEFLPTNHGFDYFYGIPYSNDMSKKEQDIIGKLKNYKWPLPFYNQDEIIEYDPDQSQFTQRLTKYAVDFIKDNRKDPFFLYLAHPQPHIPIYCSEAFKGRSAKGYYGDVIEELDWSVGEIMSTLERYGLDENTLVIFSSDNGPWLITKYESGSAGTLRDGKSSAYEGGFRVPGIFWGSMVSPGRMTDMASTLDILPTICELADIELPSDRTYDGDSLVGVLSGAESSSPRDEMFFYREDDLYAFRKGDYKIIYATKATYTPNAEKIVYETPELYNVAIDAEERYNIASEHPDIVRQMQALTEQHLQEVTKW